KIRDQRSLSLVPAVGRSHTLSSEDVRLHGTGETESEHPQSEGHVGVELGLQLGVHLRVRLAGHRNVVVRGGRARVVRRHAMTASRHCKGCSGATKQTEGRHGDHSRRG
ncbi:hypothetical protein PMAYCL1PPCAC_01822, partial [Pristionchus mayeri]